MVRLARFSRKKLKSGKTSLKYDKPGKKLKEGRLLEAVGELDNKLQLEAKLKRALTKYMDPRRRELKKLLGNPPDINNVPAKFWKEAEKEFQEQLAIALILLWDDAALGFGLDSDRASSYAQTRAQALAAPFISHSKDRLQSILAAGERPTASQLGAIFGKPRAETVAQYETGLAQRDVGQEWRKREEERGEVLRAIWRHSKGAPRGHAGASKDPCQICTPLLDTDEAVWSLVAPNGPPVHPWCDCYLEYVSTGKRLNEAFCPTGEGGGIDNSCGGDGEVLR